MASLDWLVKTNDLLESIPGSMLNFFRALSKSGETLTQSYVDIVCKRAAWHVNILVERARQGIIKTLWNQYGKYIAMMQCVNIIQKAVTDPIGTVGSVFGKFAAPVKSVVSFVTTLAKEVPRLAANLANLASALPPDPPNPNINFNAFKVEVHTITMQDILRGPDGMPTPEQMFPEPPSAFSKEAFGASFAEAKETSAKYGVTYKLPSLKKGEKVSGDANDGNSIA